MQYRSLSNYPNYQTATLLLRPFYPFQNLKRLNIPFFARAAKHNPTFQTQAVKS